MCNRTEAANSIARKGTVSIRVSLISWANVSPEKSHELDANLLLSLNSSSPASSSKYLERLLPREDRNIDDPRDKALESLLLARRLFVLCLIASYQSVRLQIMTPMSQVTKRVVITLITKRHCVLCLCWVGGCRLKCGSICGNLSYCRKGVAQLETITSATVYIPRGGNQSTRTRTSSCQGKDDATTGTSHLRIVPVRMLAYNVQGIASVLTEAGRMNQSQDAIPMQSSQTFLSFAHHEN